MSEESQTATTGDATVVNDVVSADANDANASHNVMVAMGSVKSHTIASMAAGVIPIPLFDLAAVTAIQVRMVKKIADTYGIEFRKTLVRGLIGSLLGGGFATVAAVGVSSGVKAIPVVGPVSSALGSVTMSGVATYAVGSTFIKHFESGGTLLDFSAERMKGVFSGELQRGRAVVSRWQTWKMPGRRKQDMLEQLSKQLSELTDRVESLSSKAKSSKA